MEESKYQSNLDYAAKKKRYKKKPMLKSERIPDPYAVPQEEWVDDVTKRPTVLYGNVYNYIIEFKGRYTSQSSFKSLEAFNYSTLSVDMTELFFLFFFFLSRAI